ncbi:MAG: ABC transporter ATP-binding protein, partial [Candidatus Omnitrophica bacterium]|nr:ABC transporter ATP-binding protein [Candidatus Omnitrophota bacterium]
CLMNELIGVKSLTKIYHNGADVYAVHDVSFTLAPQDYVAITGPSGAGKSTLLHIVGGLETPSAGQITFKGDDIYRMKEKHLAHWRNTTVGFVFQFYHLIEELNVLENVAIAAYSAKRKSSLKKAQELLEYLGIEERKNFFPSQLSGGEKQKTAIARALINDPQVILCDEPTGNLDIDSQNKVMHLLEELNREKKKTVVLITHNLDLAKRAKRAIHMKGGAINA